MGRGKVAQPRYLLALLVLSPGKMKPRPDRIRIRIRIRTRISIIILGSKLEIKRGEKGIQQKASAIAILLTHRPDARYPQRTMSLNDFELERQRNIDDNKRRMSELGIGALAAKVTAPTHAPVTAPPVGYPQSPRLFCFPPKPDTRQSRPPPVPRPPFLSS